MVVYGCLVSYRDEKSRLELDEQIDKIVEEIRFEKLKESQEQVEFEKLVEAQKKLNKSFLNKFR